MTELSFLKQIKYIGKYLRPHRHILIFSFLLTTVSTALGMIQPYFAKILIDRVFLGGDSRILTPLLLLLILLLIFSFVIRTGNNYIYMRYSAGILFNMREDLFDHLQRIPLSFFAKNKIGDIYSRIASDMADIQALVTETIPHYLFNLLTCIITSLILFGLNWKMALMSLAFLPVALFAVHRIRPKLLNLANDVAQSNADIAHFLFEALSNTSLIRAFGAEKLESEKLKEKQSRVLKILLDYQILGAYSGSVTTVFTVINTLVIFGYGGFLVLDGSMTVGSLVAFSVYQGRVFAPLQGLLEGFLAVQKSKVALARVREILDIKIPHCVRNDISAPCHSERSEESLSVGEKRFAYFRTPECIRGEIAFENVSFAYNEGEPVLKDISFQIPSGKITALAGPSGSGKTTICHLMMKLFDPDAGRITLDDLDLRELKTDWLRKQITLVSQDIFLFHTSILENIRFSKPDADEEQVREAAKAACIHDFIVSLPDRYHTVIGDRGIRLSGGQKQRISIARSFLLKPKILILDEATAFLDTSAEDRLKDTIRSMTERRTVIVVSHRFSTIRNADKIIALNNKGIFYEGGFKEYADEHGNCFAENGVN